MIYLDNAASTQIHEDVLSAMLPYLREQYGNPSSIHRYGRLAHKAIEKARKQIANLINANPSEILLTSGGTESNNTAIFGITQQYSNGHVITSSIEHDAILQPCKNLEEDGYDVTYLPVDGHGLVSPETLKNAITEKTRLVTIMLGNNEVGTIEPIQELVKICHDRGIPFHTDAVQAVGKIDINVKEMDVDLLSISSHKINGPKGIGALYVRSGLHLKPLILGGGQENGLRSGTENVSNIVGFGQACEIAATNLEKNSSHMTKLRDLLISRITSEISNSSLNGHSKLRLPNNVNITFLGINGEDLIIKLDENGIAASTGSACSVRIQKESHVLRSMGLSHEQIQGSLRLTVGINNTEDEINETVTVLKNVITELRAVSPFKVKYQFNN